MTCRRLLRPVTDIYESDAGHAQGDADIADSIRDRMDAFLEFVSAQIPYAYRSGFDGELSSFIDTVRDGFKDHVQSYGTTAHNELDEMRDSE